MLVIKPENIQAVLLRDGWHHVYNQSFALHTCRIGDPKTIADRNTHWGKEVANWQERLNAESAVLHSITVPFDSILGIREVAASAG